MSELSSLKNRVRSSVGDTAARLTDLSLHLHGDVELAFQEHKAQGWLCDVLEAEGFAVERGLGSLPTAFRATAGTGHGPRIAFLCEYDGLPEYGHSCGHNVVAAAGAGAGIGLKEVIDEIGGTVVVLGTPGEEGGGGKYILYDEGYFDGIDAMMLIYPGMDDIPHSRTVAAIRGDIQYFGKAAHAAARPELGINALDAMIAGFTAVNALRQHLPSDVRVHGIITKGGTLGQVVPDHTRATMTVRANDPSTVASVLPRVQACFAAAATAAGARVEQSWPKGRGRQLLSNATMAQAFGENLRILGREPQPRDELSGAWSGDSGAISWEVPTIQPQMAMTGRDVPPHSHEFHDASATPAASRCIVDAAAAMACTGVDLLVRPDLLDVVREEHQRCRTTV